MHRTATTIAALLLTLCAHGQRFGAGPCLGLAASQVDGDSYAGYHKAGPIAGIWVQLNTGTDWAAMVKLRYIQKGCRARGETPGTTRFALRLNYIELPLTALYRINPRMCLCAGLSGGYLATLREFNLGGEVPQEHTIGLRRYELTAMGGISIDLHHRLRAEAIFSYSALPLRPTSHSVEHWHNRGGHNNVLEISLLYEL